MLRYVYTDLPRILNVIFDRKYVTVTDSYNTILSCVHCPETTDPDSQKVDRR